jgi:acyl-CoA synthetase (AMP-forming)/AMP-acid ligase II
VAGIADPRGESQLAATTCPLALREVGGGGVRGDRAGGWHGARPQWAGDGERVAYGLITKPGRSESRAVWVQAAHAPPCDYWTGHPSSEGLHVDSQPTGRCRPRGQRGLRPGGDALLGHYRMPDETARVLRGGWLHAGDVGRLDDDGFCASWRRSLRAGLPRSNGRSSALS